MPSFDCVFPEDWTVDNLLGKHKSRPYNPLIAGTLYRAGLIESWGRGIDKIINACKASGNKLPEFMVRSSEISVTFEAKLQNPAIEACNTKEIDEHNSNFYQNERSLKEVLKEADYKKMLPIIEYISENDSITTKKAEELIGKSYVTAYRYIKALESLNVLQAEGKTDNSQYMVIK